MPTYFRPIVMTFNSQEGSQTQQNMIQARLPATSLRALDQTKLFDSAMILLNSIGLFGEIFALCLRHFSNRSCPMFRAAVLVNCPKHSNQSESLQPENSSRSGNENFRDWLESFFIRVHFSIRFQPGQKMPANRAHQFQIFNRRIPAIKTNKSWFKSAIMSLQKHFRKMIVFGFSVGLFIKDSIISWNCPLAISPEQRDQIDAPNYRLMLSRLMPRSQSIMFGKRFIQSRIIQNQNACFFINLCFSFLPERFCIRFKSRQKPSKSIMCRSVPALWLHTSGFCRGQLFGRSNDKLNVIFFSAFRRIHALFLSKNCSTACLQILSVLFLYKLRALLESINN
jgi:hypothetical protein